MAKKTQRNSKTNRNRNFRKDDSNCNSNNNANRKPKEVELNVDESRLNKADLGVRGHASRDNDVAWYAKNEALLRDSASFPYGVPLGTKLPTTLQAQVDQFGGTTVTFNDSIASIPGVCSVHWIPTIGISDDTYSAANLAARNIYSFVRHANSGSANYDSPDLMMYLLATDSCYSFYAMMVRAYGCMQTYSATNRYLPKALIQAMGLNFDDLMLNLPQFRYFINQYALKLGSLCVPAEMAYIERHIWMNSGVYTDSALWKAQTYTYVQDVFYKFVEVTQGPGYLEYTPWITSTSTSKRFTEIASFANQLIEPLLASEDIGIMSGDILKAFGRDNLFFVNMIAEEYAVAPAYSPEVLSQIENSTILGYPTNNTTTGRSRNIIQDVTGANAGAIRQHFEFESTDVSDEKRASTIVLALPRILNMHLENPTAGDSMVASRLTNIVTELAWSPDDPGKFTLWVPEQTGSEICSKVVFHVIGNNGALSSFAAETYGLMAATTVTARLSALVASFDWAPQLALVRANGTVADLLGYTTDFDNYTSLTANDLKRMHDAALLSEFDVPQMARLSTKPTATK